MPVAQYIFLFILMLVTSPVWATTFFVDTAGNDTTGTGSSGAPWRTLQKCHDTVPANAGHVCSANDGVYTTSSTSQLLLISKAGITFKSTNARGARLSGNSNVTANGVQFGSGSSNTVLEGFEVFGFSTIAISINPGVAISGVTVRNNYLHDIGRRCSDSTQGFVGVFANANGAGSLVIERNLLHTIGRFDAGESGCSPSTTIYQNNDHAIYIDGGNTIQIRNNLFYDIRNGWSIQLYQNPISNLKILNNTFADANPYRSGHVLLYSAMTTVDVSNNIFYQPNTSGIICGSGCFNSWSGVTIRNNLATNDVTGSDVDAHSGKTIENSLVGNPLFTDADNRNYTLNSSSSPAKDNGVNLSVLFTNDYLNATRVLPFDIGAYEFLVPGDITPPAAPTGLMVE